MKIRIANISDLISIVEIYNQAVRSGNATADLTEVSVSEREEWFSDHASDSYPIYVVEKGGEVIGWGSLSPHRKGREALRETAEISYYIHYGYHRRGFGHELIQHIINDCPRLGFRNLFAIMLDTNKASEKVLKKLGFTKWGHLPDVAKIRDKRCGQFIYGIHL